MYSVRTLYIQCMYSLHPYVCTLYIQCTYSVHTVDVHCTYTPTLCVQCTYNVHTMYVQCTYIGCTMDVQCRFGELNMSLKSGIHLLLFHRKLRLCTKLDVKIFCDDFDAKESDICVKKRCCFIILQIML